MTKIEELEADLRLARGIWERQNETIAELTDKCNRLLHEKSVYMPQVGYGSGSGGSAGEGIYHGSESMSRDEAAEFARISAERAKLRALQEKNT